MSQSEHFDAVVVGSGFGGSVMAFRLAEAGMRVCVLERGKPYPPGSFARSPREMRDNFWDPSEGRHGLFQVWSFRHIDGVVSAGLGGGSLIYANVLIRKDENWFAQPRPDGGYDPWPVSRSQLDPHYDRVESMLAPQRFPFDRPPYSATPKTGEYRAAAEQLGLDWSLPLLAVTFGDPADHPAPGEPIRDGQGETTDNLHGRPRYTCRLCGECNIGCNSGSKNTLDYNYLTEAGRLGAVLRHSSEVRTFAPRHGGGYIVRYVVHRDEDRGTPTDTAGLPLVEVTSDRLILSAGTFGTTYLLLKNRTSFPRISDQLGHHFSGNGDFLGLVHGARVDRGGRRKVRVLAPSRGPVITSTVRVPDTADGGDGPGFYIQDGGYPEFVDWLVEASAVAGVTGRVLRFARRRIVSGLLRQRQPQIDAQLADLIGDAHRSASLLPLLGMGRDTPDGIMTLDRHQNLDLEWSADHSSPYFQRVKDTMRTIAGALDADFAVDPLWHLHQQLVTVHPVGGCSMAGDHRAGVVDSFGEVFGYPGLVVADGSVMPGPVGPNPSFTIAALSDRFAQHQIDQLQKTRSADHRPHRPRAGFDPERRHQPGVNEGA
jgi:cholesterol oxidase